MFYKNHQTFQFTPNNQQQTANSHHTIYFNPSEQQQQQQPQLKINQVTKNVNNKNNNNNKDSLLFDEHQYVQRGDLITSLNLAAHGISSDAQLSSAAICGFEFINEYRLEFDGTDDGARQTEYVFVCTICKNKFHQQLALLSHLQSFEHLLVYIENYPQFIRSIVYDALNICVPLQDQLTYVLVLTKNSTAIQTFPFTPVLSDYTQIMQPTTILLTGNDKVCGLEYIVEYRCQQSNKTICQCKLCGCSCDSVSMKNHIKGKPHFTAYYNAEIKNNCNRLMDNKFFVNAVCQLLNLRVNQTSNIDTLLKRIKVKVKYENKQVKKVKLTPQPVNRQINSNQMPISRPPVKLKLPIIDIDSTGYSNIIQSTTTTTIPPPVPPSLQTNFVQQKSYSTIKQSLMASIKSEPFVTETILRSGHSTIDKQLDATNEPQIEDDDDEPNIDETNVLALFPDLRDIYKVNDLIKTSSDLKVAENLLKIINSHLEQFRSPESPK